MEPLYEGVGAQFYSTTEGQWIDCTVNKVLSSGEVQVDCRPGYWMPVSEQQTKLRPVSAAGEARPSTAPAGYPGAKPDPVFLPSGNEPAPSPIQIGTSVQYYSVALGTWMDATVDGIGVKGEMQVTFGNYSVTVHQSEQAWKLRYPGPTVTFGSPQAGDASGDTAGTQREVALSDLAAADTASLAPGWPFAPSTETPVAPPAELYAAPPEGPPALLETSNQPDSGIGATAATAEGAAAPVQNPVATGEEAEPLALTSQSVDAAPETPECKARLGSLFETSPVADQGILGAVYRHSIVNALSPRGAEAVEEIVPSAPSVLQDAYRQSLKLATQPVLAETPAILKDVYRHSVSLVTRPILTEGALSDVYRHSLASVTSGEKSPCAQFSPRASEPSPRPARPASALRTSAPSLSSPMSPKSPKSSPRSKGTLVIGDTHVREYKKGSKLVT